MDSEGTRWFPLADIKSVTEECGPSSAFSGTDDGKTLVFADFLIWCYAWAIDCSDGPDRGRIALLDGTTNPFVADSFEDFLDSYLHDDLSIHPGGQSA